MGQQVQVFVAASMGAAIPLIFGWTKVPYRGRVSRRVHRILAVCYVVVAGYVATSVFGVPGEPQAFVLGIGFDLVLFRLRSLSRERSMAS